MLEGVAGATLFGMMLLTTADVGGRYFFNSPILGAVELTQLMLAALVFLSLPVVCWRQEHVSVDLLDAVFPVKLIWIREVIVNLIVTAALWVMRIPANVTGHYGDRDRFAHGLHAGESFVR
jgi:TRAP-type C4-dicarboxylate transport system permease small subunit